MPRPKNWKPVPLMEKIRERVPAVDTVGLDECLIWPGAMAVNNKSGSHGGYGHFGGSTDGVRWTVSAPRVVLENKLGRPIKTGLRALHTCDNRPCINPHHLYEGTAHQNSQDMVRRDRATTGERQPNAKLSEDQIRAIRTDSRPQRVIAGFYGISQSAVSMIKSRKRWSHITGV